MALFIATEIKDGDPCRPGVVQNIDSNLKDAIEFYTEDGNIHWPRRDIYQHLGYVENRVWHPNPGNPAPPAVPDRTALDRAAKARFLVTRDSNTPYGMDSTIVNGFSANADVAECVASVIGYPDSYTVWEAVAHVGPKPQPSEREVITVG